MRPHEVCPRAPWTVPFVCLLIACLPYPPETAPAAVEWDPELLHRAHRDEDGFFNPWQAFDVGPGELLRMALTRNPWGGQEEHPPPVIPNDGRELASPQHSARLTWVGHATVAIHDGPDVVLTDPHFSERAGVPRRKVPPGLPLAAIPADAMAVISHNHYDHLDAETVEALPASVQWFVPLGLAGWFRERGRERVVELDWWESARSGRWTITCLPSQHWSRRLGQGTNETLWCSWLLDSGDYRYYFAGDTGYFGGFAEYGRRFPDVDVAILPIGAYEPRWFMRPQHMNPAESVRAYRDLGARFLLPMHWGTFELTHEPLDEPPRALRRALDEAGIAPERAPILAIGEGWHLPEREVERRSDPDDRNEEDLAARSRTTVDRSGAGLRTGSVGASEGGRVPALPPE